MFSAVSSTRSSIGGFDSAHALIYLQTFLVQVYTLFLEIIFSIRASLKFLSRILIKSYTKCFAALLCTDSWTPHMSCCLWSFHCISATVATVLSQVRLSRKQELEWRFVCRTFTREWSLGRGKIWATITVPTKDSASANPMVSSGVGMAHSEWEWGSWTFVLLLCSLIGWELLPSKGMTLCLANVSNWGNA